MEDLKKLQIKLLEIACDFDDFCRKNNLQYYLMGGSALGAIRHKGFIPWDDDFDVFMPINDYFVFLKEFENYNKDKYHLQKQNSKEWSNFFSKIRMNNTTFIEEDSIKYNFHQGIYIDIMCLYNCSNFFIFRYLQYLSARLLVCATLGKTGYNTKKIIKKIALKLCGIFVRGVIKKILYKIVCSSKKSTKYVAHWFGRAKYKKAFYPRSIIGEQRYVNFENKKLPVPEHAEEYLKIRYGANFMEMPSLKVRAEYKSHALLWDTERDYKFYLQNGELKSDL